MPLLELLGFCLCITIEKLKRIQDIERAVVLLRKVCNTLTVLLVVVIIGTSVIAPVAAGTSLTSLSISQGRWWETVPQEEATSPYYDSIPYWKIGPLLREIELKSNRVRVQVIGKSVLGRNLYLAVVSAPEAFGRLGRYQALRKLMIEDPVRAHEMIDLFEDFKVCIYSLLYSWKRVSWS